MEHVTVVICNFNYGRFLRASIDSALAQTYRALRVLVIDDGSTDDSRDVIESYGSRIDRIYKDNGGQGSAYNLAIDVLAADYAVLLDADDTLYPDAIEQAVRALRGGYAKAQFRLDLLDSSGVKTGTYIPNTECSGDCAELLTKGWLYPAPPGSGHIYRVSALKRIFPVPDDDLNRLGADFYAIYGVALQGKVAVIPRSLGGYRIHQNAGGSAAGFPNSEGYDAAAEVFNGRWSILREMAAERLGITLPMRCHDFAIEKARFCTHLYEAPFAARWRWLVLESRDYLYTILANPFWSLRKKAGALLLSCLCLLPLPSVSNFAVRYIVNPMSRRRVPA